MDLSRNNFVGPIPSDLYDLTSLRKLSFYLRLVTHPFSSSVSLTLSLTFAGRLILRENGLTGTLAPSFSKLSGLSEYFLPNRLGRCTFLVLICFATHAAELDLDLNKLEGTLTTEFRPFSELTNLNLSNNGFRGNFNFVFQGLNQLGMTNSASSLCC